MISAFQEPELRHLLPEEIENLKRHHNTCVGRWSDVVFLSRESPALPDGSIRNCVISGRLLLIGGFGIQNLVSIGHNQQSLTGLYSSSFSGVCILFEDCRVSNVEAVSNMIIKKRAVLFNCSYVVCHSAISSSLQGRHVELCLGPESGGRNVSASISTSYPEVCRAALSYNRQSSEQSKSPAVLEQEQLAGAVVFGEIGEASIVHGCAVIKNSLIGNNTACSTSSLDGCTIGDNCSIISSSSIRGCLLHDHCTIENALLVESTVLYERSSICDGARVCQTILGPDSSVAGGECHHSLVGPMIGFHHSSLLIATLWPFGRGNVAYGAKVGANHTGR